MIEHRFRELIAAPAAKAPSLANEAFVPCPCFLMASFTPGQQAYISDVYRIAREMTEAQLRKPARSRIPAFSLN